LLSAQRKITSSHLERLAVVYLRQSTPAQVRLNVRSTERQYAIAGEAARLGWESERIVVVDGDLGVSGRDTRARESYKQLVARVCLGEVGAIFGLEVSRLARNNAEPVLRRGVRVRALPLATSRPARWDDRHHDGRAAPLGMAGADPRPSPRLHQLGYVPR
jgi:Resolvase, N terminal domain